MKTLAGSALALILLAALAVTAVLTFGGPKTPPPLLSVSNPFKGVSFEGMPASTHFTARDGTPLAYRHYAAQAGAPSRGSVMLVHGSSANSQSVHPLAHVLAQAGYAVYALDIRGHGDSGARGQIGYIGQLEDDLEDFMRAVQPAGPKTLLGFSSGGGFVLRMAGSARQALFDNFLLLAPYLRHDAPTARSGGDVAGWASVGVPRLVALALLNRIGITGLNHLPVVDFAISDAPAAQLVPAYSYALTMNYAPHPDWQADLRGIQRPVELLEGADDELFRADQFRPALDAAGRPDIPVTLVPATGHINLTLTAAAHAAILAAIQRLDAASDRSN